jgi:hypothetical protein
MAQNKCVMLRFFSESQRGNTGIDAGLGEIRGRINSFPAPTPIPQIGQGSRQSERRALTSMIFRAHE